MAGSRYSTEINYIVSERIYIEKTRYGKINRGLIPDTIAMHPNVYANLVKEVGDCGLVFMGLKIIRTEDLMEDEIRVLRSRRGTQCNKGIKLSF